MRPGTTVGGTNQVDPLQFLSATVLSPDRLYFIEQSLRRDLQNSLTALSFVIYCRYDCRYHFTVAIKLGTR